MSKNVITDTTVREGYVAEIERLHEAIGFRYSPMLPEHVEYFTRDEFRAKKPEEVVAMMAAALHKQIASWTEEESLSMANLRRLPWKILNRLFNVVAGLVPSDKPPKQSPEESDEYGRTLLEAANQGLPAGIAADQLERKNSDAG